MMKKSYILIALGILACLCVIGYIDYGDTIQEGLTNKKASNHLWRLVKNGKARGLKTKSRLMSDLIRQWNLRMR